MKTKLMALALALLLLGGISGCAGGPAEAVGAVETPVPTQTPLPTPTPVPTPTVATLAVCGDVMSHMPVTNDALNQTTGTYEYGPIMAAAGPLVAGADYAVANFETTMAGGPNYSGYPNFNSPDALAKGIKDLGFDLMLTANNHCLDKRGDGLIRTLDVLDGAGLAHVGTSRTEAEAENNIVVADVGGISVAFLGYTYGTNGIPLPEAAPYAVNLFNTDYLTSCSTLDEARLADDLAKARDLDADLIAVMIHWGVEYQTKENAYQEQVADFLLENGADLILGGHPHVLQPMELRTVTDGTGAEHTGFVSYSLGNFISSQVKTLTDMTAVLTVELTKDNATGETAVTDYTYAPMLMLNRGEGAEARFELLDAYRVLEGGSLEESLIDKLHKTIETCHSILGPEGDPKAGDQQK